MRSSQKAFNQNSNNLLTQAISFLSLFKKNLTLIQIGAHIGKTINDPLYDFLQINQSFESHLFKKIVLVEPDRDLIDTLKENYKNYKNVYIENAAVSDSKKTGWLYKPKKTRVSKKTNLPWWFDQIGSLDKDRFDKKWDNYEKDVLLKKIILKSLVKIKVRCITIKTLLKKYKLTKLNVMQIDSEGYDYKIIKSFPFNIQKPQIINYERVLLGEDENLCRNLLVNNGYYLINHGQDTLSVNKKYFHIFLLYLKLKDLKAFIKDVF